MAGAAVGTSAARRLIDAASGEQASAKGQVSGVSAVTPGIATPGACVLTPAPSRRDNQCPPSARAAHWGSDGDSAYRLCNAATGADAVSKR